MSTKVVTFILTTVPTDLSLSTKFQLKKALRGVRVETTHQQGKRSIYKITGITPVPLAQLRYPSVHISSLLLFGLVPRRTYSFPFLVFSFSCNEGPELTVVQYFAQRYNYRLRYTAWPCLQSGNDSKPIYLPMEVIFASL